MENLPENKVKVYENVKDFEWLWRSDKNPWFLYLILYKA
jgi:hypothetical protein